MQLFCLGFNHQTMPLGLRERLAYTRPVLAEALSQFSKGEPRRPHSPQLVILSTCNRGELYALLPTDGASEDAAFADPFAYMLDMLVETHGVSRSVLMPHVYSYEGKEAAQHLCRVAAGLDSMILGEPQILGQVSDALDAAVRHQAAGTILKKVFHTAIRAGRRARHETNLNRKSTCISSVAVRLAQKVTQKLDRCRVVIVGGGEIGSLSLRILREESRCELALVNRTLSTAQERARQWGATAYALAHLPVVLVEADLVITSTAAPEPVLSAAMVEQVMQQRAGRPLTVIDVAVPRDVDPMVKEVDNVRLFALDDLEAYAQEGIAERRREIPKVERIIEEEVQAFLKWQRGAEVMPLIADLRHKAEFIRQQEVARTLHLLGELEPDVRRQIEHLSHALVNKLLHEPTTRLRSAAKEGQAAESAETVRHLFALANSSGHAA